MVELLTTYSHSAQAADLRLCHTAALTSPACALSLSFNPLVLGLALWRRVAMTWYGHRLIIFGFLPQSSKTKAVAVGASVQQSRGLGEQARSARLDDLAVFRCVFYDCLTLRADALFELTDAVLCADGRSPRWSDGRWLLNIDVAMVACTTA